MNLVIVPLTLCIIRLYKSLRQEDEKLLALVRDSTLRVRDKVAKMIDANNCITSMNKHTVDMMEERSKDETAKVEAEKELAATNAELDELAAVLKQ